MKKIKVYLSTLLALCVLASATTNIAYAEANVGINTLTLSEDTEQTLMSAEEMPDIIEEAEAVKNEYVTRDVLSESSLNTLYWII